MTRDSYPRSFWRRLRIERLRLRRRVSSLEAARGLDVHFITPAMAGGSTMSLAGTRYAIALPQLHRKDAARAKIVAHRGAS